MYAVSQAYRDAIKQNCRMCYLRGTITTTSGDMVAVEDRDISSGSLYINNQCVNGSDFMFGAVFSGELGISVQTDLDRYRFYDAEIRLSYFLETAPERFEEVPLGVFYVENSERSGKYVDITAYDAMSRLDVDIQEDINGTPYELLSFISEKCGVEMAQTPETIGALTNGTQLLSIYATRVETYRDAVSYIAAVLACFAVIDRAGRLELRQFAAAPCTEIIRERRNSTTISDFRTYYDAVKVRFVDGQEYKQYSTKKETPEGGLTLDLGDNPIVQGLDKTKIEMLDNLFSVIRQIDYTPYIVSYNGDPAIDLGDMVSVKNINGTTETITSLVTHYDWKYRGKSEIKAVGGNPKMQNRKERGNKQFSDLEAEIALREVVVHTYTNSQNITIKDQEKEIISINYAAAVDAKPLFIATVPLTINLDGELILRYYIDGVLIPEDTVTQYLLRGNHFVTISNNFVAEKDSRATISVMASMSYTDSDIRQQAAKITSIEQYINTGSYTDHTADTTIPTATVKKGTIKAVLYAQGLVGTEAWDGTINASEEMGEIAVMPISVERIIESADAVCVVPIFNGQTTSEYMKEVAHEAIRVED